MKTTKTTKSAKTTTTAAINAAVAAVAERKTDAAIRNNQLPVETITAKPETSGAPVLDAKAARTAYNRKRAAAIKAQAAGRHTSFAVMCRGLGSARKSVLAANRKAATFGLKDVAAALAEADAALEAANTALQTLPIDWQPAKKERTPGAAKSASASIVVGATVWIKSVVLAKDSSAMLPRTALTVTQIGGRFAVVKADPTSPLGSCLPMNYLTTREPVPAATESQPTAADAADATDATDAA